MSQCRTLQKVDTISKTFAVLAGFFPWEIVDLCHICGGFSWFWGVFVLILCANRVAKGCTPCGLRLDSCSCSPSIAVPRHQACHGTGHTQLTEVIKQLCSIPVEVVFGLKKSSSWKPCLFVWGFLLLSVCFFKLKSYHIYIYMDFDDHGIL